MALGEALCLNTTLTELDLEDCKLGAEGGAGVLAGIAKNTSLTSLTLSDNGLSGAACASALGDAFARNATLTALSLREAKLGAEAAPSFASGLGRNRALAKLEMGNCALGAGAAALGSAFATNGTLTDVDLSENQMGDEAAAALLTGLASNRASAVVKLELSENDLGEETGKAVALLISSSTRIRELNLSMNRKLGSAGGVAIGDALARGGATLRRLNLSDSGADDASAKAFENAMGVVEGEGERSGGGQSSGTSAEPRNLTLEDLDLDDNAIGAAAAESLFAAMKRRARLLRERAEKGAGSELPEQWKLRVKDRSRNVTGREAVTAAAAAVGSRGSGPAGERTQLQQTAPPKTKEEVLAQLQEMRTKEEVHAQLQEMRERVQGQGQHEGQGGRNDDASSSSFSSDD